MRIVLPVIFMLLNIQLASGQVLLTEAASLPNQYIVEFANKTDNLASQTNAQSRRQMMLTMRQKMDSYIARLRQDLAATDLKIIRSLWLRQSVAINISADSVAQVRALPYVSKVSADRSFKLQPQADLGLSGEMVNDDIARIDFDQLWSEGYRGQGVVIAILDTGVDYLHKDLRDSWRGGSNSWYDPYGEYDHPVDPLDSSGNAHGTAVASIILGGNQNETGEYLGIAPHATWIGARVISGGDASESAVESAIISALQWVLDPDGDPATDDYPDIVQNSWGITGTEGSCSNPFAQELAAINATGIDIVFSVGNSGDAASSYLTPSWDPNVISVGAIDSMGEILSSSARGPDDCNSEIIPSLVAPGSGFDPDSKTESGIIVADSTFGGLSSNLDNIARLTGTSISAPMVAGALALLRSKFTTQDHLDYRQALYDSALPLGASSPNDSYGRGLVQLTAASQSSVLSTATLVEEQFNFSMADLSATEADSSIEVVVLRSGNISEAASVRVISTNGSARQGEDYLEVNQTVDFLEGESAKAIQVELIDDSAAENTETFNLQLTSPSSGLIVGSNGSIDLAITDNDSVVKEDKIGGSAFGLIEILLLSLMMLSGLLRR